VADQNLPPGVKQRVVVATVLIRIFEDLAPDIQVTGSAMLALAGLSIAEERIHASAREMEAQAAKGRIVIPDLSRKN
jgi:hypothetical protein